jgi:hypothetical protein
MALNDVEIEVDTQEVVHTELFDLDRAPGIPYSLEPSAPLDEEQILDADDVAAELVPDMPSAPPPRRSGIAAILQPSAAGGERSRRVTITDSFLPTALSAASDPFASSPTPSAAAGPLPLDVIAAHAEIARLQRQMRARDAYLVELERALNASTRQLEAAGLGSVEDALRLLGRVRGQAFRIAELESELRQVSQREVEPSSLTAARKAKAAQGRKRAARVR